MSVGSCFTVAAAEMIHSSAVVACSKHVVYLHVRLCTKPPADVCCGGYRDSGLITTLILFSHRPLKLPPLHQVSVWLPGNQGSGVPERRCLFLTNDPPETGKMGGGEDE